jgi:hypothetical protein|tara:strand:- start:857 stop:1264 length:408 start_codon:yes stop_codon:yes gene_type:complete
MKLEALKADTPLEAMLPYRKMLVEALNHSGGSHTFQNIVDAVQNEVMQFWPMEKSCLVTEVINYPNLKTLHIFLAGGDLEEIKSIDSTLEFLCQEIGADYISLSGRRGWIKALADIGYELSHVTLAKKVKEKENG